MPAALTAYSSRPNVAIAWSTIRCTSLDFDTSTLTSVGGHRHGVVLLRAAWVVAGLVRDAVRMPGGA